MIARTNIEQQLFNYVAERGGSVIVTTNGINLETVDEYSLQAEYTYVDTNDTSLSVALYSEKKIFVEALNIKTIADIDALTPGRLIELYHEGLAEIVCFVTLNYTYSLIFQKSGNVILATNESNRKHTVPTSETLETHDQFIAYTKRYYKLLEANEN